MVVDVEVAKSSNTCLVFIANKKIKWHSSRCCFAHHIYVLLLVVEFIAVAEHEGGVGVEVSQGTVLAALELQLHRAQVHRARDLGEVGLSSDLFRKEQNIQKK